MDSQRLVLVVVALLAGGYPVRAAEIILDDFEDDAIATSPAMADEFVETTDVGDLSATRGIRVFSLREPVVGTLDSNVSETSELSIELEQSNQIDGQSLSIVSYQGYYEFALTDLTDGGRNNALLFDLSEFTSTGSEPELRVFVSLLTPDSFAITLENTYTASLAAMQPRTIPLMFDDFGLRGGTSTGFDLSAVVRLSFSLRNTSTSSDTTWSGSIDRVRIGRVIVPEPASLTALTLCILIAFPRVRARLD